MGQVRCEICRVRLPTARRLMSHYIGGHSKLQLARQLLNLTLLSNTPKVLTKKNKRKTDNFGSENVDSSSKKAKTLFVNDSIQILYKDNEIIIKDKKSSVDMEFSFDESSCDSKGVIPVPEISQKCLKNYIKDLEINNNNSTEPAKKLSNCTELRKKLVPETFSQKFPVNISTSSASSEESSKGILLRKKNRRRRDEREKTKHYKINITRMGNSESLDENTGTFYLCHCRDKKFFKTSDLRKITSDTESASDTGKNSFLGMKVFCSKCGNGYRDESMLLEHMKIHETHCRVCNEIFPTEYEFKQHIQTHMFKVFVCHICSYEFPVKAMLHNHFEAHAEDSILESVIDMEEDYKFSPCPIPVNLSYQSSINHIVNYLKRDTPETYNHNDQMPKLFCDICLSEFYYCDYESHVQTVHGSYN